LLIVWNYNKNSFSLGTIPVAFCEPFSEICMDGRSIDELGLWPYMVTLLNWTYKFDWHMPRLFLRTDIKKTQVTMRLNYVLKI
jgi:hypothetical protein